MSDPLKEAKVPRPGAKKPLADAVQDKKPEGDGADAAAGAGAGDQAAAGDAAPEAVLPSQGAPAPLELPTKDGKPLIAKRAKNAKRVSWYGSFVNIKPGKVCSVASYGLAGLASLERQGVEFEDIYE